MGVEMLGNKYEKMYTRRINQVGNSLSVNIPKDLATMLNINKGDEMEIYYDKERGEIVMKRANRIPKGVRPEVVMAMNRAIAKYDEALRNLKDR
ncbi:AbrB/MazE/SpoVT family DNA-binding domain-containing protein [Parageobacillus thermoglucosidasius]|jgi:antitoxin MazE|uniref:Addiction module antidote protein n=3 Tax=Anoxybacillaceae TaxID=3120669 RepID=A0AAN1D8J8_PARTM|nr:AbrB/MazE/SpoVT family DNA-binding domain-containing protein [Parageobacillus thermoglucosidasius]AEH49819.1 addiction module antidote [Parageobacillus thermoglucosidasius C56-YS93]ANZ32278.1 addiction module antidote protein [Parageobacillus thermoglucosidasius]APM83013.1 addiction module antidote protein [Parageobacillus thermoglucosidasius]KJX67422.1 addiction module antidote protein [Parageobacillus thermoglucosidasius]MBY6270020.1 AbrB/MazE/SpoVT family DNA-binding domain-containing pr